MNSNFRDRSDWPKLFSIASSLIDQVNSDQIIIDHWTFGGGTALMLHIGHRESHDIDIFLPDPQYLNYLNPEIYDFTYSVMPNDYGGDGSNFRKFAFKDIGEIDFIVAGSLTSKPAIQKEVSGKLVNLETVEEIITKKIVFRCKNLKPRDIFDIAAAGRSHEASIVKELSNYREEGKVALEQVNKLKPEYIISANKDLMIKDTFKDVVDDAVIQTKVILEKALK